MSTKVNEKVIIIDSILHTGNITVGNKNDVNNMFARISPNLEYFSYNLIVGSLMYNFKVGTKLEYTLSDRKEDDSELEFQIGDMWLNFKKIEDN